MSNSAINQAAQESSRVSAWELAVKKVGRFHYVTAGVSKLSKGFATAELAQASLDENAQMYRYWAGSASVSSQNTTPKVVVVG